MNKQIAFIGCGNMGEAILESLLAKRLFKRSQISVADSRASRRSSIKKAYGIKVYSSNSDAIKGCDIVLLAIKPQNMADLLMELGPKLKEKLIISIAAGVSISYIGKRTGAKRIMRVMPNTPALVGVGISALSSSGAARASDIRISNKIFGSFGEVISLGEKDMDAVTAISGSGPAYFFLLMEAMIGAALSLGINRRVAEALVSQTSLGAAMLQNYTDLHPSVLRKKVTSKGGTTEAALKVFKKRKFESIIRQAITAASKRAKEISK